jgi:hypothetical protein
MKADSLHIYFFILCATTIVPMPINATTSSKPGVELLPAGTGVAVVVPVPDDDWAGPVVMNSPMTVFGSVRVFVTVFVAVSTTPT